MAYTIKKVSQITKISEHTIRFWAKKRTVLQNYTDILKSLDKKVESYERDLKAKKPSLTSFLNAVFAKYKKIINFELYSRF